jgi:nucleoside 2-deoxyribosyltransferase
MKIFLISPVRGADQTENQKHYDRLALEHEVYYPFLHTNQVDDTGLRICRDNLAAIQNADAVAVIWDGKSQGCLFDLGMAFALGKPVIAIELPTPTDGKSFQNMVRAWWSGK